MTWLVPHWMYCVYVWSDSYLFTNITGCFSSSFSIQLTVLYRAQILNCVVPSFFLHCLLSMFLLPMLLIRSPTPARSILPGLCEKCLISAKTLKPNSDLQHHLPSQYFIFIHSFHLQCHTLSRKMRIKTPSVSLQIYSVH